MRAQGALEYLIIIAAVLGITAVVVVFLTGAFSGSSAGADLSKCRLAAANCQRDITFGLGTSCIYCETACVDSAGLDLISGTLGCGDACMQCKTGSVVSGNELPGADLKAYWGFDEATGIIISDSSGSNTGTYSGQTFNDGALANSPMWVSGRYGTCLNFSDTGSYVSVASASSLNANDSFTIMAWIKTTDGVSTHYWDTTIAKDDTDYPNKGWRLVDRAGSQQVMMGYGTSYGGIIAGWIADGNWHHWTATLASKRVVVLFLDGVQVGTTTLAADFVQSNSMMFIGGRIGNFNGTIDSVRYFNKTLTPAEIQTEMNSARPVLRPVANWELDETAGAVARDTHIWTAGRYNSGISFDGVNDYITVPRSASLDLGPNFTIVAWVKFNRGPTPAEHIIGNKDPGSFGLGWVLFKESSGMIKLRESTGSALVDIIGKTAMSWGTFHIVAVKNGSNGRIYLNGVDDTLSSGNMMQNTINTNPVYIGAYGSSYPLNGTVDEVRIYNRTLSESEVRDLYNSGR